MRDSGLLHSLLQVFNLADLQGHPKIGASWEGFAIEHIIKVFQTRDAYFWATHAVAELDFMVTIAGKRHGFELKYTDAPGRKRSKNIAIEDLGLEHLWVVYPGDQTYGLDDKITVIPLEEIAKLAQTGITT
ncbi:MAG: DUF4143 domain-containing protein [Desulfobacterales bacterium]